MHVCMYVRMHAYMYVCAHAYICVCMYEHMYIYICTCIHVYIYLPMYRGWSVEVIGRPESISRTSGPGALREIYLSGKTSTPAPVMDNSLHPGAHHGPRIHPTRHIIANQSPSITFK